MKKYNFLCLFIAVTALTLLSATDASAWSMRCPNPDGGEGILINCSNDGDSDSCTCRCPHPHDPGGVVVARVGQSIQCFSPEDPYDMEEIDVDAPKHCIGVGAPIVDCSGDPTVSARADISWIDPPEDYERPQRPRMTEGFWKAFFNQMVPGAGNDMDGNVTGSLGAGRDDPDKNLQFNSQYKALPFCESPIYNSCFDISWKNRLSNCKSMPSEVNPNTGKSMMQECLDKIAPEMMDCLTDISTDNIAGGPWDHRRVRKYHSSINSDDYMEKAIEAAEMEAQVCIHERLMSLPAFEGAFDVQAY